jgi:hypothetical protein
MTPFGMFLFYIFSLILSAVFVFYVMPKMFFARAVSTAESFIYCLKIMLWIDVCITLFFIYFIYI